AVEIAGATDALLDHADARLALAAALRAAGRHAEARAEETRALELWDAKGATLLAERARGDAGRALRTPAEPPASAAPSVHRFQPNAATAAAARLEAAFAARDADAIGSLFSASFEGEHHPTGTTADREGLIYSFGVLLRARDSTYRLEPLATLGNCLALCRHRWSWSALVGAEFDVGPVETNGFSVLEVDAQGHVRSMESVAADHLGAATVRLYERHAELLPEGPECESAASIARFIAALGRMDGEGIARALELDVEAGDRRRLGLMPTLRGANAFMHGIRIRDVLAADVTYRIDDILALRPDAILSQQATLGTIRASGGAYENPSLALYVFR